MKLATILTTSAATLASARPQYGVEPANPHEWMAAGPNDFRGPCPMLNTLANHGFLPRDGRNFTQDNVVKGLKEGLNFNGSLGALMWEQAIIANPEPNATFFTLDQLNVHNLLEHDASLTRTDAAFGNNHVFNETVYNASKQFWTEEIVTAEMLVNSKLFRQIESRATNPNYTFTTTTEEFSLGEIAAPMIAFGSLEEGTVPQKERLPFELGWTQKTDEITLMKITAMTELVRNATNLFTGGNTAEDSPHSKRDLHGVLF
ncbi:Chloroperoxidase-like protein [Stemphylium lycopersici]|uniref:Chloroperoxidase-like protein n=1 Tax=Stemphylium lycopersici TaxID=183478 RepID=A0A364MVD8_STELY|nr:Chloroperoxidase-like protein [Stemphylium lycopersici]